MTLEDLFKKLSYAELRNLAAAVEGTGAIKKEAQNQVVHYANEALLQLYTRFALLQSESLINLTGPFEMLYPLGPLALQVVSLITPTGESISFGVKPIPGDFYVWNRVLHIPRYVGAQLQVTTQDRHPELTWINSPGDLAQTIDLPSKLTEALTAHIAYKMYRDIRTPEALTAAADHKNRFEEICTRCQIEGLVPGELLPGGKFEGRGWI